MGQFFDVEVFLGGNAYLHAMPTVARTSAAPWWGVSGVKVTAVFVEPECVKHLACWRYALVLLDGFHLLVDVAGDDHGRGVNSSDLSKVRSTAACSGS